MNKRVARNAMQYFLSDKFSFNGSDFMAVAEIIRELTDEAANGTEDDAEGGHPQDFGDGGSAP